MRGKNEKPIRVALYGMDGRTLKTMVMYLQGPCRGIAVVVDELDAEVDVIDADFTNVNDLVAERQSKAPNRPILILSLKELSIEGTIFVKKPVQATALVAGLKEASALKLKSELTKKTQMPEKKASVPMPDASISQVAKKEPDIKQKLEVKKNIDNEEIKKTSKHQAAKHINERGFSIYIGNDARIDFSDRAQVLNASFNPQNYFLGYVQSAFKVAREKARIVQLNSSWEPIIIFPHSHDVWLDADDKQLRVLAGFTIKNSSNGISLSSVSPNFSAGVKNKMDNFYDMDAFLWKLAIWTSKGRYPNSLDINRPVYLKRWPNFTRLVITPHALRIAALLIIGPRTLTNIADSLKISPQYVFVFISAAYTLGLVGQAEREVDQIVAPPEVKATKSKGLFSKILGKLRA